MEEIGNLPTNSKLKRIKDTKSSLSFKKLKPKLIES